MQSLLRRLAHSQASYSGRQLHALSLQNLGISATDLRLHCRFFATNDSDETDSGKKALSQFDFEEVEEVDLNEVTLDEYRESLHAAVDNEAEMLSSDPPHVYDPLNRQWEADVPRPKGPIHTWPLRERFGSTHQQEQAVYDELEASPMLDLTDSPLYDISTDVPLVTLDERADEELHALEQMLENPDFLREMQSWDPAYLDPPYKGARPILNWTTRNVFDNEPAGVRHPLNRKVTCSFYLRDLQEQTGLSDDALQHIARILGPRYDQTSGKVKIACERYRHREDNRRWVAARINDLVAEGMRAYPSGVEQESPFADAAQRYKARQEDFANIKAKWQRARQYKEARDRLLKEQQDRIAAAVEADYDGVKERTEKEAAAGWLAGWHQRVFGDDFPKWDPEKEGFDATTTWPVKLEAQPLPPPVRAEQHWLEAVRGQASRTMPPYEHVEPNRLKKYPPWMRVAFVRGIMSHLYQEGAEEGIQEEAEEYQGEYEEGEDQEEEEEDEEGKGEDLCEEGKENEGDVSEEELESDITSEEDEGVQDLENWSESSSDYEPGSDTDVEELFAQFESNVFKLRWRRGQLYEGESVEEEDHGAVVERRPVGQPRKEAVLGEGHPNTTHAVDLSQH